MPRVGLTRQEVIEQAAAAADEAGLDHLTLAAVAQRCGVSLPGLYKHVNGLDAVKRDIAVLAVREITVVLAGAAVGITGREALTEFLRAYRGYARAHPGHYAATLRAPAAADTEHENAASAAIGVIAAALKGYRLEGTALIHAVRLLRAAFHGIVSLEIAGGFGLPAAIDDTYAYLVDALDTEFRALGLQPH
jgi:AcrR family transcriptional regulator